MKNIKLSDIKIQFGGKFAPKDKKFIELYKKAFNEEIPVYWAMIDIEAIKPYSKYKPEPSQRIIDNTHQRLKNGKLPAIYVYSENDYFIMSDDYLLYYTYFYSGYKAIPCIVLGEPKGKSVKDQVGPIKLPKLEVEVI